MLAMHDGAQVNIYVGMRKLRQGIPCLKSLSAPCVLSSGCLLQ